MIHENVVIYTRSMTNQSYVRHRRIYPCHLTMSNCLRLVIKNKKFKSFRFSRKTTTMTTWQRRNHWSPKLHVLPKFKHFLRAKCWKNNNLFFIARWACHCHREIIKTFYFFKLWLYSFSTPYYKITKIIRYSNENHIVQAL